MPSCVIQLRLINHTGATKWEQAGIRQTRWTGTDEFETFVLNVLEYYPGFCTHVYEQYVGPPDDPIEFVGKQENLVEYLITALRSAGEEFDESLIRAFPPPQNVSDQTRFIATYTPELECRVREAERAAIERYGYEWTSKESLPIPTSIFFERPMQGFLYYCSIGFGTRKPDKDNFLASIFPIAASESC